MHTLSCLVPAIIALCGPVFAQEAPVAEVAKVYGSTTNSADLAGIAVAISGSTALVGAQANGGVAPGAGAVFVFELLSDGSWSEAQVLTASTADNGDSLGRAVAISGDRAIIGAFAKDGVAGANQGAAYVFERTGGVWNEVAELSAAVPFLADEFGWSVAIDGDLAVAGTYKNDGAGNNSGAVYAFERVGGVWMQTQVLQASDSKAGDEFGWSVALDGTTLLVGADLEGPSGNGAGAVYVFEHNGAAWVETQKLKGSDTIPLDYFGWSVDLDGDRAVIGARDGESLTDPFSWDEGAAYVFERAGGVFSQVARLEASDASASDGFGYSVAVSGDRVVVGSPDQDALGNNAGACYLFERNGLGAWIETEKILATDGQAGDIVGRAVGLSGDRAVLGARGDDDQGSNAGAAYLLDVEPLSASVSTISLAAGGLQTLALDAGRDHANDLYWVFGSVTGTTPGIPIGGGFVVPLNFDAYFQISLSSPNMVPLLFSFAGLNGVGHAEAGFLIPAGFAPGLAGLTANHAFVALDPISFAPTFVSNAVGVGLVP